MYVANSVLSSRRRARPPEFVVFEPETICLPPEKAFRPSGRKNLDKTLVSNKIFFLIKNVFLLIF
jgi:hypothetical protein